MSKVNFEKNLLFVALLVILAVSGCVGIMFYDIQNVAFAEDITAYDIKDVRFQQIEAGPDFSLALDTDGHIWSWGNNANYQLGTNTTVSTNIPTMILPKVSFRTISSVGTDGVVAIGVDGTNYYWGKLATSNGNVKTLDSTYALYVNYDKLIIIAYATSIEGEQFFGWQHHQYYYAPYSGNAQSYELTENNALAVLDNGYSYRCHRVNDADSAKNGVKIESAKQIVSADGYSYQYYKDGYNAICYEAEYQYLFFVYSDGSVGKYFRDYNLNEQSRKYEFFKTDVNLSSLKNIKKCCVRKTMSTGSDKGTVFFLDDNGDIYTVGYNGASKNLFGVATSTTSWSATPIKADNVARFKDIAVGENHVLALDNQGRLYAWGNNNYGQLGITGAASVNTPTRVVVPRATTIVVNSGQSESFEPTGEINFEQFSKSTDSTNGNFVIDNALTGAFTYTNTTTTAQYDKVTISCNENGNAYDLQVNIIINHAPAVKKTAFSTKLNTSLSGNLNISDQEQDSMTCLVTSQPSKGVVAIENTGKFVYIPNNDASGDDSFEVDVSDGRLTIHKIITVHIETQIQAEGKDYGFNALDNHLIVEDSVMATDPDGDTLSYSIKSRPYYGSLELDAATGNFKYVSDEVQTDSVDSFVITVTDGVQPVDATYTFRHYFVSDNGTETNLTVNQGESMQKKVLITYSNISPKYIIKSYPLYGQLVLDQSTGVYKYISSEETEHTEDAFSIDVDYELGHLIFDISVSRNNVADISSIITTFSVNPGGLNEQTIILESPDDDTLSYKISEVPVKGTLTYNEASCLLRYTADSTGAGDDRFVMTVSDGKGNIDIVFTPHIETEIDVSSSISVVTNQDIKANGNLNATDLDGDELLYSVMTLPSKGILTVNSDGSYLFAPTAGAVGDDSAVITITDGVLPKTVEVNIHIESEIKVPNMSMSIALNNYTSTKWEHNIGATDADGDELIYSVSTKPSKGTASVDDKGNVRYVPNASVYGTDSFIIKVNDGVKPVNVPVSVTIYKLANLTANTAFDMPLGQTKSMNLSISSQNCSVSYSVKTTPSKGTVTVSTSGNVKYAPFSGAAGADTFEISVNTSYETVTVPFTVYLNTPLRDNGTIKEFITLKGQKYTGNILIIDPDIELRTYSVKYAPGKGDVQVYGDGHFDYTPNENDAGDDTFTISVKDTYNEVLIKFSLHIESIISAEDMSVITNENTTLRMTIGATDADGDKLSYSVKTNVTKGSFDLNSLTGECIYTPEHNDYTSQVIVVTVTDGVMPVDVTITIDINKPFVIEGNDFHISTNMGEKGEISINVNDPDSNVMIYSIENQALNGTASANVDGIISYVPNEEFAGNDSFVLKVFDGGYSVLKTITVHVESEIECDDVLSYTVPNGTELRVNLPVVDKDGDVLTYSIKTPSQFGTASISPSGLLVYSGKPGKDYTDVTISDGNKDKTVRVFIKTSTAPVFDNMQTKYKVALGEKISFSLSGNDTDGDAVQIAVYKINYYYAESLSATSSGLLHGSCEWNPNTNTFTYNSYQTLTNGSEGSFEKIIFIILDEDNGYSLQEIEIVIVSPPVVRDISTSKLSNSGMSGHIYVDAPEGTELNFEIKQTSGKGNITIDKNGNYSYVPNTFAFGSDSFVVKIYDGYNTIEQVINVDIKPTPLFIAIISVTVIIFFGVIACVVAQLLMIKKSKELAQKAFKTENNIEE